jgi:hypothetical protein
MRIGHVGLIVAAAAATLVISSDLHAACNIRGEFCGRPGWAANAFSNPRDRYPEEALDNPTARSVHQLTNERRRLRHKHRWRR